MKTLHDFKSFIGKTVTATSANDYSVISGKCINVRECIDSYTDITNGIRHLADVENAGYVKVVLAKTMKEVA